MSELPKRQTDIGPPHYSTMLPPVIKNNYGKWKYHEVLTPGTMVHVAESGDKVYTVRVASPRLLSTDSIRQMLDIADKYCDGYIRWTTRNNVEFMTTKEENMALIKKAAQDIGFPAGGIGD
nr:hypothetical protein [Nitrospiraceae bacterium]